VQIFHLLMEITLSDGREIVRNISKSARLKRDFGRI
jgi:hypothetical protein